ncbi:MAG: histidine phosphatase family protein [Clostridia bacterium]|nr:histidine phosphatase family protein [Clostridia bacterium]
MEKKKPVLLLDLYLIRHGQSEGNVRSSSEGLTLSEMVDPPLTAKGRRQAHLAGEFLSDVVFDTVFASPLLRAAQTATEIIKEQVAPKTLEILPHIIEAGVGEDYNDGLDRVVVMNPDITLAKGLPENTPLIMPSSSADSDGLFARARVAVDYLTDRFKNGERVAVVSHAAFLTYIVFDLMGWEGKLPLFDVNFQNTGMTRVLVYEKGTNPYGDIVFDYINNTEHLFGE